LPSFPFFSSNTEFKAAVEASVLDKAAVEVKVKAAVEIETVWTVVRC
jgi:hypothetical protein